MTHGFYAISLTPSPTLLESLAVPVTYPKSRPQAYQETKVLGDLTERGIGAPTTIWHWDAIPQAERDMLRTFCPGASAPVYITTLSLDNDGLFRTYSAVMVWPSLSEVYDAKYRTGFDILFRRLVIATP
jgi:hypothetical protein